MSTGLYSHTTRAIGTVLTAAIYNADHANHITNANPSMHGAHSDTVTQMKLTSDPGGVGSESLADSLAKELEYIRFCIKRIAGTAEWYAAPVTSLGLIGGGIPLHLAFASTPLRLRRTENTVAEVEVQTQESGSGAGNKISIRHIGDTANGIDEQRVYFGATLVKRLKIDKITSEIGHKFKTWFEFESGSAPANPAASHLRFYTRTLNGVLRPFYRDSAGKESLIGGFGVRSYQDLNTHTAYTAVIPIDDTVPLVSEGTQIFTKDVTLLSATSKVRLTFNSMVTNTTNSHSSVAIFRGSVCVAARFVHTDGSNTAALVLDVEDTPGTVGPHTYSVRVGPNTGTMYLNGLGADASRKFGGASKSVFIIEEIVETS